MVSSTVGSSTLTGCIRRSRAASFSMMRYSLSVVAPTSWSSPRARAGFRMFPASILPSPALPAPTISWISSINRITSWRWRISSMSFCMRSSNWPRIPVPWTRLTTSRRMTCLPWSFCGTLPSTIFWARPSTTAVLPTPGSPMRTGLFLVRRDKIWMTRWISLERPITGSSLPSLAAAVRSRPNWLSASLLSAPPFAAVPGSPETLSCTPPSASFSFSTRICGVIFRLASAVRATFWPSRRMPSSRCSVPT